MPVHEVAVQQSSAESLEPRELAGVSAWERMSFASLRFAVHALARCLTLPGLYRFGQVFGFLEWLVKFKYRRRFVRRLKTLLGDEMTSAQIRRATLSHFTRVRCDKLLYLIFDLLPRELAVERFEIVNRELIDNALAKGKGVYIALSHHGAHHVAGLMMCLLGYKVAGVRDRREGGMRRYIQSMYERRYDELRQVRMIYSDALPRDIYRCFKDNYVLGSALDIQRRRAPRLKTAEVDFLGEKHRFLTGTVQIAIRCGAPILQGFIISRRNFRYSLVAQEVLLDDPNAKETPELLQQIMQRYADNIGRCIRKYPAQITKL